METTYFVFQYTLPALPLRYATTTSVIQDPAYVDDYHLFALETLINDHFFHDSDEEFITYPVDLGTHYRFIAHVSVDGLPITLSTIQRDAIRAFIASHENVTLWCYLLDAPYAQNLVETYPTKYPLKHEGNKVYVDLHDVVNFAVVYEDLSVGLYYSIGNEIPKERVALDPADLPQPLLVSSAPLVV